MKLSSPQFLNSYLQKIAHFSGFFVLFTASCLSFFAGTKTCEAKDILYGSAEETVSVAYGMPTVFRFDQEVKTITHAKNFKIVPSDKESPDYSMLTVSALSKKGEDSVTFLLINGTAISLKIITLPKYSPEKTSGFYDFKPKKVSIEKSDRFPHGQVSEMDLMKSMIRWGKVAGYESRSLVRTVQTDVSDLSVKLVQIFTGPRFNGYVFKIRNKSKKNSYFLDIRKLNLGLPNTALLSQIDHAQILPKKKGPSVTFLRVVSKASSQYRKINLPFDLVESKSK